MIDILILSNGPGEIATWVRPVVQALKRDLEHQELRISVVLSPCPNAGGREADIVMSYPEVDRVQAAEHFWNFLLWGKTIDNWDWHPQGIVTFLGGDQIFPVVIGKRLGYRTLVYAEWQARWLPYIDRFAVMNPKVLADIKPIYRHKVVVVGDLMLETEQTTTVPTNPDKILIGVLPGSKAQKLQMGLPFMLAIAEAVHQARPDTEFVIPIAPTTTVEYVARFADRQLNPIVDVVNGTTAILNPGEHPFLQTAQGLQVSLWTASPAYPILSQCQLCLTTVGANTAELGALGIPMVVVLPIHQLDAMRSWDGIPGILARLPGIGTPLSKLINQMVYKAAQRTSRKFAWPNIWAGREIVPELVGKITVSEVANLMLDFLDHPEKLGKIKLDLAETRGETGAASKIVQIVSRMIDK